ncbi:MAG: hypothetical protein KatS3mg105_0189 [Gemmatales bacterium]|nr:MAG: hypothetical protein KatS3mg105_0189 [Gemmatales bacterium]
MSTNFQIGRFQILKTLGTGAHSTILHIRRVQDAKQYALKVVPIDGSEDFKYREQAEHEFAIGRMLNHPNLIKIYALEVQRDWLFRVRKLHLLLEYVNGRTLDMLRRMPIPVLLQIFAKVAAGMVHMHQKQICHADLKPNNVMLSVTGEVKILDYGLAWRKGENKNRVQGTPEYMAPEQARKKIVNELTDIYNFGAMMYRLVTWRHPPSVIAQPGGISLDAKTWDQAIKPVRECCADAPPQLCDLIQRCLSYKPSRRPQQMLELKETLDLLVRKCVPSGKRLEEIDIQW